jgi:hypothetical protein
MPGQHSPPPPFATPKRPSLKVKGSSSRLMSSETEMSSRHSPLSSGKRELSWRDDHGDSLLQVHHVWDTHYSRTCFQRNYNCLCMSTMLLALSLLIYAVVAAAG